MSKQLYKQVQNQLARAVGLQKSLKKSRSTASRNISALYDRMQREGFESPLSQRSYVPERCAKELVQWLRVLSRSESRIKTNRFNIRVLQNDLNYFRRRYLLSKITKNV